MGMGQLGSDTARSNYSRKKAVLTATGTMVVFGGLEALFILTLRVCMLGFRRIGSTTSFIQERGCWKSR